MPAQFCAGRAESASAIGWKKAGDYQIAAIVGPPFRTWIRQQCATISYGIRRTSRRQGEERSVEGRPADQSVAVRPQHCYGFPNEPRWKVPRSAPETEYSCISAFSPLVTTAVGVTAAPGILVDSPVAKSIASFPCVPNASRQVGDAASPDDQILHRSPALWSLRRLWPGQPLLGCPASLQDRT